MYILNFREAWVDGSSVKAMVGATGTFKCGDLPTRAVDTVLVLRGLSERLLGEQEADGVSFSNK